MMDKSREVVGKDINLQTLARGVNVVGLESQSRIWLIFMQNYLRSMA